MSRQKRLFSAGAVLVAGLLAAWPFRLDSPEPSAASDLPPAPAFVPPTPTFLATPGAGSSPGVAATAIVATTPRESLPTGGVTLSRSGAEAVFAADALAATDLPPSTAASPVTSRDAIDHSVMADPPLGVAGVEHPSSPRTYVIHNGDSLERIAARYLGDESRALEIFDLNREVLANPYLLPLGAELTLPAR